MGRNHNNDLSAARSVLDLVVGFVTTVEEAGGTIEDARRAIFEDTDLRRRIGLLVMGKLKLERAPCQRFVPHLIPKWAADIIYDVEPHEFDQKKLKFLNFPSDTMSEQHVMRRYARGMKADLGLSDVPALLGPDGKGLETIPVEFRGKVFVVLTGTVLLSYEDGRLYFGFLSWLGDAWILRFRPFFFGWKKNDCLPSYEVGENDFSADDSATDACDQGAGI